ncbi:MAG: acyl-CoA dehydrogenase [Syntrophomonadaceae bacterium]
MPATNYIFDTREIKFIVKEWLDTDQLLACDEYKEYYTKEDIDTFIDVAYKIARDVVAPTNNEADNIGVTFKDGKVHVPEAMKKAFKVVSEAGMAAAGFNYSEEGHLPRLFQLCQNEILTSASGALLMYWILGGSVGDVIEQFGSEELKAKTLPKLFSDQWGGSMNLTEPSAGSDLGATAAKAFPTSNPGLYKIKGNKIFITSGDGDLYENIIHMVLARVEGARDGTAGLSLFAVPKYRFDDQGNITEWNDVTTVGIEHKMGLHGSATCSLAYGENDDCYGWLCGDPPNEKGVAAGMSQMFVLMNESRLSTGLMALSVTEQAYYNAREYAKIRVQGAKMTDPKGPRVPIIEHEDVKRMLLHQKACLDAMRALLYKAYFYTDLSLASNKPEEKEWADDMFMILNPLVKAYISDMGWILCGEAIQCYGGYGFIEEYPVAQLARDVKIYSIWEGTNYIQSMDLVGRKFSMKKGAPFQMWRDEIKTFIDNHLLEESFVAEMSVLSDAYNAFSDIVKMLSDKVTEGKISYQGVWATRVMTATAMVYCAKLILEQGILAQKKLAKLGEDHYDANFYKGKIASARFYLMNEVPNIFAIQRVLQIGDSSVAGITTEQFG